MSAPAIDSVRRLCVAALERVDRSFEQEDSFDGGSAGGRWSKPLVGDWDSAIHLIGEATFAWNVRDDDSAHRADLLQGHIVHVWKHSTNADTLCINALALMARVRRDAISGTPEASTRCTELLQRLDIRLGVRHSAAPDSEWIWLMDQLTHHVRRQPPRSAMGLKNPLPLRDLDTPTLRIHLAAFVLLAALPAQRSLALDHAARSLYEALTNQAATGVRCSWPPFALFAGTNAVTRLLHFTAGRTLQCGDLAYDDQFDDIAETLATLLPRSKDAGRLVRELGLVPQVKDLVSAVGSLAMPNGLLHEEISEDWAEWIHETRGPVDQTTGIYCYLPLATSVAIAALARHGQARGGETKAILQASTDQSLRAMRRMRTIIEGHDIALGHPFAPFALYNDVVLSCWLRLFELDPEPADSPISQDHLEQAVRYLLSSQLEDGMFQQRYRANELDEGETIATGAFIRVLAQYSRRALTEDTELAREIAHAIERAVLAVIQHQNESGGFPTFARNDREKGGMLGAYEAPGVQENLFFDAPAADANGWVLEGLCEVRTGAKPIPGVYFTPSAQREIDRAVDKAVGWLRRDFHPRAGWWGRYGGAYITGTAMALRGLRVAGVSRSDAQVQRARSLLVESQRWDGGWDQDLRADDPAYNSKPERYAMRIVSDERDAPSQPELTAFALMGLLDAGQDPYGECVTRAVQFLVGSATADGWGTARPVHSFMRDWNYIDLLQTHLKPADALLRWLAATAERDRSRIAHDQPHRKDHSAGARARTKRSGCTTR